MLTDTLKICNIKYSQAFGNLATGASHLNRGFGVLLGLIRLEFLNTRHYLLNTSTLQYLATNVPWSYWAWLLAAAPHIFLSFVSLLYLEWHFLELSGLPISDLPHLYNRH